MASYRCILSLNDHGKPIPYHAANRPEGSRNHGFMALKGRPDRRALVPEAQDDESLGDAIDYLNDDRTPFFTVGCEKVLIEEEKQHRKSGYLEFAFNDRLLVSDACNYFVLFFNFSQRLAKDRFNLPVQFRWELEDAHFTAADCNGWSTTVWIETPGLSSATEAGELWAQGLNALVDSLMKEAWNLEAPIYSSSRTPRA
jgi:hypothetical protein